jgi:threonine synthase
MDHILHLQCLICGRHYNPAEIEYICPDHGYEGIVDVVYDYDRLKQRISPALLKDNPDRTIWRYKPLLPVWPDSPVPPLAVGWTPLYAAPRLAADLGLNHLWIKDDGQNPTASFKDRASAVAVVKADEKQAAFITTASTGNAAAALSGLCASVGRSCIIFVPESAPQAKIAQLLAYGATVLLVQGTYDDAFDLCLEAAAEYGWYNRNTAYNPYMTEGKKTAAYEICEQLNWQPPDVLLVSVGDGCIIGGLHKGLKDLLALGWIEKMPRLIGVQAEGSSFLARAWEDDEDVLTKPPIQASTIADSISAGLPRDRLKAMAAVRETAGAFLRVTDEEILAAIPALAQGCGVFAEPAGAAAYAGLLKAVDKGLVSVDDRVVVVNTGSGLKDIQSVMKAVEQTETRVHRVTPDFQQLKAYLNKMVPIQNE